MGEVAEHLKHNAEFEQHIEIGQVDSVREGWHEARCTAGSFMGCWSTTGDRAGVEYAAGEHIRHSHVPVCPDCDTAPVAVIGEATRSPVNGALRMHVTGSAFSLTLRKTHIEALVHIAWTLDWEAAGHHRLAPLPDGSYTRGPTMFAGGCDGLLRRGLVVHTYNGGPGVRTDNRPFSDFWEITPAGALVVGLLKEAGIWEEYASFYPAVPLAQERRT